MAEVRSIGGLPFGYNPKSPIYTITVPIYIPTAINQPTSDVTTTTTTAANNAQGPPPPSTTTANNAEDGRCCVSPLYNPISPIYIPRVIYPEPSIYIPTAIKQPTYDLTTTTNATNAQGLPPLSTTTIPKAFEMQAQAYNSQRHNHQRGEEEKQPMKKPTSSRAVPPMPQGLGCIEEQPRIPVCSFTDVVSDSDFTIEERKTYNKIVREIDGFDCPYVHPEIMVPGLLKPYPLEDNSDVERMEFDYMADLALKHYNELNGSSYQLVEVIKATMRYSAGCVYNITLRAKDDMSGSPPQNFQARVYNCTDKYKVLFCRVEGNAELRAIDDSDKHPGCWVPKPRIFIPVGYSSSGHLIYGSSSDVPATTANNTECTPPPGTTTTTALTPAPRMVSPPFEMQSQAYNSQQHNHQRGEGEKQPMKKPSSSGAVPPMPWGLGCTEEQPRIPVRSFTNVVVLGSDFTVEERKIYNKIVRESDGFDCPYVRPGIMVPGLLKPYPLEDISDFDRMEIDYRADLALKHYNDLNGSSYQLIEVIKATMKYSAGCVYNITLRAKDDMSGSPPQNFQARVYDVMYKYKVLFCRVEGNAELRAIDDSDKHPGCWVPKPRIFIPVGYSSSGHMIYGSSSDVPATTGNNTECTPPPGTTTTTALTPAPRMVSPPFEMQSQAYNSQQHNHQRGEGEKQPMKKPSSSGAVPPMPWGLGCIEEQPRIPDRSFTYVVLGSDFTVEERKIYNKIVRESDGFVCPYVRPGIMVPGLLKPIPLEDISDVERMEFDYRADLALKHYNDLNGSSYQLIEVIKATMKYSAGCVYNISLRAKDDMSGSPPQNFQARVYDCTDKYKVLFCRVEGNAGTALSGDLDKCSGCWVPKPPIFIPIGYSTSGHLIYESSSDVRTTTNNAKGPPPPCTTAAASTPAHRMVAPAFEMQHDKYVRLAQAYKSQQHNHQHGEGEERPKKKPRSS